MITLGPVSIEAAYKVVIWLYARGQLRTIRLPAEWALELSRGDVLIVVNSRLVSVLKLAPELPCGPVSMITSSPKSLLRWTLMLPRGPVPMVIA
jgi:hypothetical protein